MHAYVVALRANQQCLNVTCYYCFCVVPYVYNAHTQSYSQLNMLQAPANVQLTTDGLSAVAAKTSSKASSTAAAVAVHDTSQLLPLPWGSDSTYSYAYDMRAAITSNSSGGERVMRGLNHLQVYQHVSASSILKVYGACVVKYCSISTAEYCILLCKCSSYSVHDNSAFRLRVAVISTLTSRMITVL
jgi:hypothetical protein